MSFNKQSSNSDIDNALSVDDPSDLSVSSLSNSSSLSSSSSEELDISVIPIKYDKDVEKIITELKIDRQHLEGLNLSDFDQIILITSCVSSSAFSEIRPFCR